MAEKDKRMGVLNELIGAVSSLAFVVVFNANGSTFRSNSSSFLLGRIGGLTALWRPEARN